MSDKPHAKQVHGPYPAPRPYPGQPPAKSPGHWGGPPGQHAPGPWERSKGKKVPRDERIGTVSAEELHGQPLANPMFPGQDTVAGRLSRGRRRS